MTTRRPPEQCSGIEACIDAALGRVRRRYGGCYVAAPTPQALVGMLSQDVCTNLVKRTFKLAGHVCAEPGCSSPAQERCHGESRPDMLLRAVLAHWHHQGESQATRMLDLCEVLRTFLELHRDPAAGFCYKCRTCHRQEQRHKDVNRC